MTRRLLLPAARGIPDSWNPVLVAAVRSDALGAAGIRRAVFWGMGVLLLIVLIGFGARGEPLGAAIADSHLLLYAIAIFYPGIAAASLAGEREPGKLDLLRSTLLTPRGVLRGKLLAALFGGSGLLGWSAIVFLILFALQAPVLGVMFLAGCVLVALVGAAAGLFAATVVQGTTSALVLSYAVSFGALLVLPAIALAFTPENGVGLTASLSPLLSFSMVCDDHGFNFHVPFLISLVLSSLLAFGLFQLSAAVFARTWLRDR
jgi:ABC-type Na+ efflux pump permease subunit